MFFRNFVCHLIGAPFSGIGVLGLLHYLGGYYPSLLGSVLVCCGALSIDVFYGVSSWFNVKQQLYFHTISFRLRSDGSFFSSTTHTLLQHYIQHGRIAQW